jgi:phage-related baseplate assembly protein
MPLIINSNGKIELISPAQKYLRGAAHQDFMDKLYDELTKVANNQSLTVATGEALDKLADIYGVRRMNSCSPDGEFTECHEESDEALRTRVKYLVRGYV